MGGEREILSSGRKKFGRRRVALKWEPAEKNPYREGRSRVERCGEVARLPFLGCTGAKMIIGRHGNARPTSFRFFRDPCAFRRTPLTPKRRLAISLVFPPLSLSRRALSIVFREGAERMALAKSRSLPFEDLPTGGHLPPSIPPLGKSARG